MKPREAHWSLLSSDKGFMEFSLWAEEKNKLTETFL